MRRFFIDAPLADTVTIRGQDARHIGRVLRLAPGDELVVVDAGGQAGLFRITDISPTAVIGALVEKIHQQNEPPVDIWLAQGLPKADKMEYIVQKAVEIGVNGVIPMAVDFSTVHYDEAKRKSRVERWGKIAQEAAKQCGRGHVPAVTAVDTLAGVLASVQPDTTVIMLYEGENCRPLKAILDECQADSYLLLVGPEGGFSAAEAGLCRAKGVHMATLGPRILRTETASLAALAIVLYEKGDLGG